MHWWDERGPFAGLHSMNAVRVPLIRRAVMEAASIASSSGVRSRPLEGVSILDVGCGGGILSEALARLGGKVLGVDASEANILAARAHKESIVGKEGGSTGDPSALNLSYECITAEALLQRGGGGVASSGPVDGATPSSPPPSFQCVVSSEVLEHVENVGTFLDALCALVKVSALVVCRGKCFPLG